jgi:mono/diheme cytochrome c family protein
MKRALWTGVVALLSTAVAGQAPPARPVTTGVDRGAEQARKMLDTYCIGCHNSRAKAGGVALDTLPLDAVHDNADVWEKAVRKMRGRLMPPPTSRQPDQQEIDAFMAWMEARLDAGGGRGPVAGHVVAQRLTRTEFAASVNDLLGIELDAEQILPAEIEVNGFENIAAALSVSPSFLDQYVAAARSAASSRSATPPRS